MKRQTPDERFLFKLYELAMENGDPFSEVDIWRIAQSLGQKETATRTIIKHLAQANFIKKVGETKIYLTPHGHKFVTD